MKLRNKKTGEIFNFVIKAKSDPTASYFELRTGSGGWEDGLVYGTIEELHREWEDYKPTEPLIKDEKIRKAVKVWAEAFGVTKVYVYGIGDGKEYIELYAQDNGVTDGRIRISIPTQDGVWIGKEYAVDELCEEEEE